MKFEFGFDCSGLDQWNSFLVDTEESLKMQGPVIVGVRVDYRDNHRRMEDVHFEALN